MSLNLKRILGVGIMVAAIVLSASAQSNNPHSRAHKGMIAKASTSKDRMELDKNTMADLGIEELEPEIDIYTEGWNSKRVNPFNDAQVPATDVINLRGFHMPTKTRLVTSNYGYRKKFGRMHKGMDIHIKMNDTIYAAFDGKVRLTNYEAKGYGNYIILRHPNKLETVYGHLNRILVKPDQTVKAGQPIALGGNTGRSTGPHLHFETRYMGYAINPQAIVDYPNGRLFADTYTFNKSTYTQGHKSAPSNKNNTKRQYTLNQNHPDTYTVKNGDTLFDIAKRFGMSTTSLCRLNKITENAAIRPGQILKLK